MSSAEPITSLDGKDPPAHLTITRRAFKAAPAEYRARCRCGAKLETAAAPERSAVQVVQVFADAHAGCAPPVHQRFAHSVVDVAMALHGHATGSRDPIPPGELRDLVSWLGWRLGYAWEVSTAARAAFDGAVRDLARQALALVDS